MTDKELKREYWRWVAMVVGIILWFTIVPGLISSDSWFMFLTGVALFAAGPLYLFLTLRKLLK